MGALFRYLCPTRLFTSIITDSRIFYYSSRSVPIQTHTLNLSIFKHPETECVGSSNVSRYTFQSQSTQARKNFWRFTPCRQINIQNLPWVADNNGYTTGINFSRARGPETDEKKTNPSWDLIGVQVYCRRRNRFKIFRAVDNHHVRRLSTVSSLTLPPNFRSGHSSIETEWHSNSQRSFKRNMLGNRQVLNSREGPQKEIIFLFFLVSAYRGVGITVSKLCFVVYPVWNKCGLEVYYTQ